MQQDDEKQAQATYEQEVKNTYNTSVETFKAEHDDWDEVVGQQISIPEAVGQAIVEMADPAIPYYLGKNPEVCKKLMEMSPARAIAEIGRIAGTLTQPEREEKHAAGSGPDKQPIVSKAPPPIAQLRGHGTKSAISMDQMDYQDFAREREKELKNRFRR